MEEHAPFAVVHDQTVDRVAMIVLDLDVVIGRVLPQFLDLGDFRERAHLVQ